MSLVAVSYTHLDVYKRQPTPTPISCPGENINETRIKQITTYNIKNGGLPSEIGPFPKGAIVVLYYKSLLTANYKPKIVFSYEEKTYEYVMPVLDEKWEDGEGIGGSNCELSSEFNVSEEPLPLDCGTNTGLVFEATETDWPEGGTFCSVGDPNPVNPIFPALGMTTEWECEGTSGSVGCSASRLKPVSPPPVVVEDPEPPPPSPVAVSYTHLPYSCLRWG